MQPHGRGARPPVIGKKNWARAPISTLLHVGRITEMGGHLALIVLHSQGAGGGAVLDGFAIDAHLALALRMEQLGECFVGLVDVLALVLSKDRQGRGPRQ